MKNIEIEELHNAIGRICERLEFEEVPESEVWRIPAMKEAALVKSGHMQIQGFSDDEVEQILAFICTQ